ncbi:MAG: hypothetical protein ACPGXK_08680 [Phycisphaerae bacterium]
MTKYNNQCSPMSVLRHFRAVALVACIGLTAVGCAKSNPVAGHNLRLNQVYMGNMEISGNGNQIFVKKGSNIPKLSIAGDVNTVTFEDGALVNQIDIWGNSNTVSIPHDVTVTSSIMGQNQIIFREEGEVLKLEEADE